MSEMQGWYMPPESEQLKQQADTIYRGACAYAQTRSGLTRRGTRIIARLVVTVNRLREQAAQVEQEEAYGRAEQDSQAGSDKDSTGATRSSGLGWPDHA